MEPSRLYICSNRSRGSSIVDFPASVVFLENDFLERMWEAASSSPFPSSFPSTLSASASSSQKASALGFGPAMVDGAYRPLPSLYMGFFAIWCLSAICWTVNTWRNRTHFQTNNLQWMMASVPLIKALQLALSFSFWYSCINLQTCSLWMSFGVYVTGNLYQTASFVSFMLISHGYCIMYERLSVAERRTTAALGCILYLTLVGYKASIPCFTVLLLVNYSIAFYVIFRHIAQNLLVLREQLSFANEDVLTMNDALHAKYSMFKKFQGAMQLVAVVEIMVHLNASVRPDNYWLRLLARESAQLCIFLYIWWTFRTQEASSRFFVMPASKSKWELTVPPIYSLEMDAADFQDLASHAWHVGVPTSFPSAHHSRAADSLLIIVQHPRPASRSAPDVIISSKASGITTTRSLSEHGKYQV